MSIYSVSILDSSLQDKGLPQLFSRSSQPAMLLLENIDSASLSRETQADDSSTGDVEEILSRQTGNNDGTRASLKPKSSITLSRLFNAMDGVAAPEGHILIMTSNRPENLDPALVRAGSVDVNV